MLKVSAYTELSKILFLAVTVVTAQNFSFRLSLHYFAHFFLLFFSFILCPFDVFALRFSSSRLDFLIYDPLAFFQQTTGFRNKILLLVINSQFLFSVQGVTCPLAITVLSFRYISLDNFPESKFCK